MFAVCSKFNPKAGARLMHRLTSLVNTACDKLEQWPQPTNPLTLNSPSKLHQRSPRTEQCESVPKVVKSQFVIPPIVSFLMSSQPLPTAEDIIIAHPDSVAD
jgi:hypothetical protein